MSHLRITASCIVLAATVAGAQAEPRGIYHPDDFKSSARKDIKAAERLHAEQEAEQTNSNPNNGWSFTILVAHVNYDSGYIYTQPMRYGEYKSQAECEQARIRKIDELDRGDTDAKLPTQHFVREWTFTSKHLRTTEDTHTTTSGYGPAYRWDSYGPAYRSDSVTHRSQRQGGQVNAMLPQPCFANIRHPAQTEPPPMKVIPKEPGKEKVSSR